MHDLTVSFLIPTHNRARILERTLESMREVELPPGATAELVVVANGCTDHTREVVQRQAAHLPFEVRCVDEPRLGVANARNRCLDEARGQYLVFLDDDVLVDRHWLLGLLEVVDSHPADLVISRVELWWEAVERPDWLADDLGDFLSQLNLGPEPVELRTPSRAISASMLVKREVRDRVGHFDARLGRTGDSLLGGEETQWIGRAMDAGFRVFYAPNSVAQHWVDPKRVSRDFFVRVAKGRGRSQIYMKPRFGPVQVARALAGHAYLLVADGTRERLCEWRGDPTNAMRHRVRRCIGQGGLIGIVRRTLGLPIQAPAAQRRPD